MRHAKQLQVGTLVSVPGPVFDARPGRKPRRLSFDGKITALYQAKGGPAAEVDFVALGDNFAQGKYLLKDLEIARFGKIANFAGTRFEVLKGKLNVTDEELSLYR